MTTHAPLPYKTLEVGSQRGTGSHIYLTDANGRKIAAVWGSREEKTWTADHLMVTANHHAALVQALKRTAAALDEGENLTRDELNSVREENAALFRSVEIAS